MSLIILPFLSQSLNNFDGFLILDNDLTQTQKLEAPQRIYTDYLDVKISAKSALAVDAKTGEILYKKNSQEILPIASITKLMTALVFLEHNPGWQKEVSTLASDRRNGGIVYLNTNELLTVNNLFKTALIVSDNDAAMALARITNLPEEEFIKEMNRKARELGLKNTYFVDPTGLNPGNKSTAEEIAKLLNVALQNEEIKKTISTAFYEFEVKGKGKNRKVVLRNTDWLLKSYLEVIGGKTGSLEDAGYCLAVKIKGEKNQEVLIVILGSQSNEDRFQDVKAISDWVFSNYQW